MTVTPASLQALQASARTRRDTVDARIAEALKKLRRRGANITISSLAREADVSRSVIHRRKELRKQIRSYQPLTAVSNDVPPTDPNSESSIVAALRSRLKQREAQIAELKAQLRERDHIIATLHGELARTPPQSSQ
ncbi:DUF6262 family protein [Mycolicibacterium mageritense]|uniref:DUF6262 family protein n=1 Tax=Mycolicibacterium mageritense TaxID=53462 RepID=UPI001E38795B|nr:DUF6262 family protein [Mycolicibacterium mageritense]GJJ22019.1 hypothetical protein MTY414_56920 [Mycolicibacterium mageritense]